MQNINLKLSPIVVPQNPPTFTNIPLNLMVPIVVQQHPLAPSLTPKNPLAPPNTPSWPPWWPLPHGWQ